MHKAWLDHRYEFKSKYLMNRLHPPSIKYIYNQKKIYTKKDTISTSTTLKSPIYGSSLKLNTSILTTPMAIQTETTTTSSIETENTSTKVILTKRKTTKIPIIYSDLLRNESRNSLNVAGKLKTKHAHWSGWNNWSECSRSCGGGITTQIRKCLLM